MYIKSEKPRFTSIKVKVVCVTLVLLAFFLGATTLLLVATLFPMAPTISNMTDILSAHTLATSLERQVKQWQDSLFLEAYAANYFIDDEDEIHLVLTGQAYFRFIGWRDDWLGKVVKLWNSNHLIVSVAVNVDHKDVTEFSHSHGEPFGYDAPLDPSSWPVTEKELFQICDDYGGREFRVSHQIQLAHVDAATTRPGRFWTIVYGTPSEFFKCIVNIDSGEISVKNDSSDWLDVGNLRELD